MRALLLVISLAILFPSIWAENQYSESRRVEKSSQAKYQSGVIMIKPTKISEYPYPFVRKSVVRIKSGSPVVITSTSKAKTVAVPTDHQSNEIIATTPATGFVGSYQYSPTHGFTPITTISYNPQKYTYQHPHYQQQQVPVTTYQSTTTTPITYSNKINKNNYYDHFQNQHLQTAYLTPPHVFAYAPAYAPSPSQRSQPQEAAKTANYQPVITKAKTIPVSIYYSEEPATTEQPRYIEQPSSPVVPTRPRKKVRKVKKLAVPVQSPPTVTYHSYNPATTVSGYNLAQIQQPYLQNLYATTTPQINYVRQSVEQPGTITTRPYTYANSDLVYPTNTFPYATTSYSNPSTPSILSASSHTRPRGLGITYSEVGPGIATYNFQGFGVEYGY